MDASLHPKASWEFDADIAILTHATTIKPRYQAVIHCEIVRQSARVIAMNKEEIRSGDRAQVRGLGVGIISGGGRWFGVLVPGLF